MTKQQIASMIDHTLLKATATPDQIRELCATARELGTASVCVNPCYVALAAEELKGSPRAAAEPATAPPPAGKTLLADGSAPEAAPPQRAKECRTSARRATGKNRRKAPAAGPNRPAWRKPIEKKNEPKISL